MSILSESMATAIAEQFAPDIAAAIEAGFGEQFSAMEHEAAIESLVDNVGWAVRQVNKECD
jgi:hypothetical protein